MKQEEFINLHEFESARTYWSDKLSGELHEVRLPPDYPVKSAYEEAHYRYTLSGELAEKLLYTANHNHLALYVILLTTLKIVLFKYLGQEDIITASPVYNESSRDYNRYVLLRDIVQPRLTFKELLLQVKETVLQGYQNDYYHHKNLFKALSISPARVALLLENIHKTEWAADLRNDYENDIIICAREENKILEMDLGYNASAFKQETVSRFVDLYLHLLHQVLQDTQQPLDRVELIPETEKQRILQEFNRTRQAYPEDKAIHQGFRDQVEKTPGNIAVSSVVDTTALHENLESAGLDPQLTNQLKTCCFKKSSYIFETELREIKSGGGCKLLKTHRHNCIIVNRNVVTLLDQFDGTVNLDTLFSAVKQWEPEFLVYSLAKQDVLEIISSFNRKEEILVGDCFEDFIRLVKALYREHLVELAGVNSQEPGAHRAGTGEYCRERVSARDKEQLNHILNERKNLTTAQVLLLGDTPGTPTTGLLYLASYLQRQGIKTYCQFYDANLEEVSLKENLEKLLEIIQPRVVGISLKWFPYIARVLEMAKIVKEYAATRSSQEIKVVLGGNTASYYHREIIANPYIDYVIRGDGEVPLLKICRDAVNIPNSVAKIDEQIVEQPFTYIQNKTNAAGIYLSHLEQILLSQYTSRLGIFFIPTHKGCPMDCLYCGGARQAQEKIFNRVVYDRDPESVRKDLHEALGYASTFMFDFVSLNNDRLLTYCKKIWAGIELATHFCIFVNVIPPSPELIRLANQTFKYVYWDLDMASLSERHRKHLEHLGVVKPQPTDAEIMDFFSECEKYPNNEVRINLINGLPGLIPADIEESERVLSTIMSTYSCFSNLHWARLHAQPAAPVLENTETYAMYSYASTYEDFLEFSRKNFILHGKRDFSRIEYPYIYFKDDSLNAMLSKHYTDTGRRLENLNKNKRRKGIVSRDLSYRQLDDLANRLAQLLRKKGIGPEDIVGLLLESSLEMVISILGVLKTEAAYLPIDPLWPLNRKNYVLENSGLRLLLTRTHLRDEGLSPLLPAANLLAVDADKLPPLAASGSGPGTTPRHLAYVIYTSGTTGDPRGVMVHHQGLVNYTHWRLNTYRLNAQDVTLELLTYSFDGFASNFYSALLSGGRLIMIPDPRRRDPGFILEVAHYYRATNTSLVPGLYQMLLEEPGFLKLTDLRFVVLAGEKSSETLVTRSRVQAPQVRLINEYGPTEATVTAVARLDIDAANAAVMGKPIANTTISILNRSLELMPIGVPGECCISGPGVARGYLNNPELTFEKFCLRWPGALSEKTAPGPRKNLLLIYKTGDLARWLSDGSIEFLGRVDHQLKIRGYRVEPGEIETQLMKYHRVKAAVVLPSGEKDNENSQSLYAYILVDSPGPPSMTGPAIDTSAIKSHLARHLPEYMIPSLIIPIDTLPLTPNGKIDREALANKKENLATQYREPETELEQIIAETWKEVLQLEKIGINHNFFDLGGNSIKMIKVNNLLKNRLGIDLPLMSIFEYTTIRSFADFLQRQPEVSGKAGKETGPLNQAPDQGLHMLKETLQIIDTART
jgi:amino acid adenylation domain-containing protein